MKKIFIIFAVLFANILQGQTILTESRINTIWGTGQVPRGANLTNTFYTLFRNYPAAVLAKTDSLSANKIPYILANKSIDFNGQSVGNISTLTVGSSTLSPSSVLDMTSITKGILIPRMTTTQRDAIISPANGLLIYNTTTSTFNKYSGSWGELSQDVFIAGAGAYSIIAKNNTAIDAPGAYAVAEGELTHANGIASHAEGYNTTASDYSHAEGYNSEASGSQSHAEGSSIASGLYSHAEGNGTTASNSWTHAGGLNSTASGTASFVHGSGSTASGNNTAVFGANIIGNISNTTYVDSLRVKSRITGTVTVTNPIVGSVTGNAGTVTTNANLTGDVTSVGNATTLSNTTVTPGTYTVSSVTVDSKGRITSIASGTSSSLFTDGGTQTYLTSTSDNLMIGTTADLGSKLGVNITVDGDGIFLNRSASLRFKAYDYFGFGGLINTYLDNGTTVALHLASTGEDSYLNNTYAFGLGVNAPLNKFHVNTTTDANGILLTKSNVVMAKVFGYNSIGGVMNLYKSDGTTNSIKLIASTEHSYINTDQNFTIGTSTDLSSKLGIKGVGSTSGTFNQSVYNSSNVLLYRMDDSGLAMFTKGVQKYGSDNNRATDNKILYQNTTDAATATELTTDGAAGSGTSNRILVPLNTTLSCVVNIAVKQSGSSNSKQMLRQFLIVNNAGVTTIEGSVSTVGTDIGSAGLATVTCTITANDTNDAVKIEVNGVLATNLRFTANVVSTEVTF